MPHHSNVLINGVQAPSVNEVTSCLSKDSLINQFWRKLGFKKADEITKKAADLGTNVAHALDMTRKTAWVENDVPADLMPFVAAWKRYQQDQCLEVDPGHVELHLKSTKYAFHGSPDFFARYPGQPLFIGDDKVKDKAPDYKILMNEAGYIQAFEETTGEKIKDILILCYHPKSAVITPYWFENKPEYLRDFLHLRETYEINKRAEAYYKANCQTRVAA
jgi:hypothetical protein